MKSLIKWWPAALAVVIVIGVAAFLLTRNGATAEEDDLVGTYQVTTGNLVASISPTGEVYAPRQSDLIFEVDAPTELIEVNIAPGKKVVEGELLARIDDEQLERAVTQAQADLTLAEANLEAAQNPYTDLDLVQAQVAVDQAHVSLQEAQEALAEALDPLTDLDLAAAQLQVESSKTDYERALEALAAGETPDPLDIKSAQVAVAQAETALADARQAYSDTIDGPTVAQVAAAESEYMSTKETYESLLAGADQDAVNDAKRALDRANNSLYSAQLSRDATCGNPNSSGSSCDNAEVNVWNQEISVAQAQEAYNDALEPPTVAEIAAALAKMEDAKDTWETLQDSPTALDVAKAAASVAQAEYNLTTAEEKLAEVSAGADALELAELRTAVSQANYAVAEAEENLADLQEGLDAVEIARLRTAVAQAEYNLSKAQETLAEVEAGADPDDVEVAEAKWLNAQATLEEAQQALEDATMEAPFDGTIISVNLDEGDDVTSNKVFAVIADLSNLEVLATVDETDITGVEIGQLVQITFDSFPGERLIGEVLEVPLQGSLSGSIMVYEVPISLDGAEALTLKSGMTANCTIVLGRRENALLIPTMAIQLTDEGNVVLLDDGSESGAIVPIETGLSDGLFTQVVAGLNEGDRVKVQYNASQDSGMNLAAMRQLAGGAGRLGGSRPPGQ